MASRGSGISPPNESFLSRKKKEIVDRSMAIFEQSLERCLNNSVSTPRRTKRQRDDEDTTPEHRTSETGPRTKRKRAAPEPNGLRLACPFYKHDPAKYKNHNTCSGHCWKTVHRLKEHIYRNHVLKNCCPRCLEHFDGSEALKDHQRAKVPCELKQASVDTITDEQEKKLHTRAKPNVPEEEKWREMYQIIFPGEEVPSPYHELAAEPSKAGISRFSSPDEVKELLRTKLPPLVRRALEKEVDRLFEDLQEKVNQKTVEIIRDVELQMLRTIQFGEEQSVAPAAAHRSEPSPPLSPGSSDMASVYELMADLRGDPMYDNFCNGLQYDLEDLFAGNPDLGCANSSDDSAYFTLSDESSFAGFHEPDLSKSL